MSTDRKDEDEIIEIPGDALKPGTDLLHGQYTIVSFLNAGGFGMTYLAKDSLERTVVIKECFPSSMCCRTRNLVRARSRNNQDEFSSVVSLFGQEARRLSKLSHPNIVGIHQVFEDNGTAYMALDYIEGYDMMDTIEHVEDRLDPKDVKAILNKLLRAIAYIHDHDILHRDISPDNILLDDRKEPSLIDFGAAREEATRASRILSALHVVKDGYSPQEFYLAGAEQDASSDLYSLAATFYHVITGKAPPNSQRRVAAIAGGKDDPYVPLSSRTMRGYDEFFLSAIDIAMNVFPQDRLHTAHEWIERIDTVKRRRAKLVQAQHDKRLEASISELVAATNSAVSKDEKEENKKPWFGSRDRSVPRESQSEIEISDPRPNSKGRKASSPPSEERKAASQPRKKAVAQRKATSGRRKSSLQTNAKREDRKVSASSNATSEQKFASTRSSQPKAGAKTSSPKVKRSSAAPTDSEAPVSKPTLRLPHDFIRQHLSEDTFDEALDHAFEGAEIDFSHRPRRAPSLISRLINWTFGRGSTEQEPPSDPREADQ